MRKLLFVVLAAVVLSACGEDRLKSGSVIDKVHEPERTYVTLIPVVTGQSCTSVNGTQSCTPTMMPMPFTIYDGEDFKLKLRDGDKTGWAYVDPAVFERTNIGDWFGDPPPGTAFEDPNNRRQPKS